MQRTSRFAALAMAGLAAALSACHHAPPPPPAPVAAPAGPNQDSIRAAEAARARAAQEAADRARADSIAAAEAAARAAAAGDQATMRATLTQLIHFDYDKSDLRDDARASLDQKIPILQANGSVTIRVAGNTDERGSDEYNLALGERRAAAAKRYLVEHGIADSRIETISYGEERPVAQGSDESAWSQNRRDEFEITAGGQTLKRP
jgi:peptidoglycan-associated lipoprotein